MIENKTNSINLIKEIISNNKKLIGSHKEYRRLLQESRDLHVEKRNAMQKFIDIGEKMLSIMMKNPAKYGGLDQANLQKLPEVVEAKGSFMANVSEVQLKQYPQQDHADLMGTARRVVDRSFDEINASDLPSNRELLFSIPNK